MIDGYGSLKRKLLYTVPSTKRSMESTTTIDAAPTQCDYFGHEYWQKDDQYSGYWAECPGKDCPAPLTPWERVGLSERRMSLAQLQGMREADVETDVPRTYSDDSGNQWHVADFSYHGEDE